jgi:uncharacterized delta-60 repeat protein
VAAVVAASLVFAAPTNSSRRESFGGGSKALADLGSSSSDWASAVAIQADGKLVAAGQSDARGRWDFALARYTARGRLDPSFGRGGTVLTDFGSHNDFANAVAIRDGKLVAVGSGNRVPGPNDFALARYTADGSLDPSFGRGGKVLTDLGSDSDTANAVATEADGKLVAAGQGVAFALARYTADGSLDPRFGRGGKVLTGFGSLSDIAHAIAIQADGKLVAVGSSGEPASFALARYAPDGSLEPSFGRGGKVLTDFGSSRDAAAGAVAIQADGKLVAAGGSRVLGDGRPDFALARYAADGSLDPSFGPGGKVLTDFGSSHAERASAVAIQADGKLVAVGWRNARGRHNDFALARYTADGRLDPSFGPGGKVLTDFGTSSIASAVAIQADGKLVAAGLSRRSGYFDFALARYTPHGRLDRSFGRGGKVLTDVGSDWVTRVASLTARRTKSGVLVHWRTASEVDARAFNVYRHQNRGRLMRVNRKLITSKGSASHGAAYSFLDRHAPLSTQRYWLEEVRRNGTRLRLGQVTVIR